MNLKVGDPLTVKIRIFGEGSLEAIQMPSIDHWTDFKTYPPNARTEASDPSGLKGSRFFEQVVIPQNSEMDVCRRLFLLFQSDGRGLSHDRAPCHGSQSVSQSPGAICFQCSGRGSLKPVFQSPGLRTLFPSSPFLARAWR